MSKTYVTVDQPNDKATKDFLRSKGITFDDKGQPVGDPFQGTLAPEGPTAAGGPEATEAEPEPSAFTKIEEEGLETPEPLPGDEPAAEEEPAPEPPGETRLKGEEKRLHDAREAQSKLGKLEARIQKQTLEMEQMRSDLDQRIQQLAALQATVGVLPNDLNPADAATVADWRENQPEAVSVMEAIVAPLYKHISQLREQNQGITERLGEYLAKTRQEEVERGIYSVVPKPKVDALMNDPAFLDWLAAKPATIRSTYVEVLKHTSKHSPEDALEIFRAFSRDTGTDLGFNGAPQPPKRMPTAPAMRSGGALPETLPEAHRTPGPSLTPLSTDELAHVREGLYEGTQEQRDLFRQRLELTTRGTNWQSWMQAKEM